VKIFKHWKAEKRRVRIDGLDTDLTTYGGSNTSLEEAALRASEKMEKVLRKINGEAYIFNDYQVEIREEILQTVDEKTIITRNRYGAQVMNAENLMFLDIDKPKASLGGFFKKSSPDQDKEKIFDMVRKLAATPKYQGLAFRVYETYQGARVIVLGKNFDPQDRATLDMMNDFNCDRLYTTLCKKQACFRARLTPKPRRINMESYKVKFPRETVDGAFESWLKSYEYGSRNFSVCKFIEQIGTSPFGMTEAVRIHDEVTGAAVHLPLA